VRRVWAAGVADGGADPPTLTACWTSLPTPVPTLIAERRESVALAFVAALQRLSARLPRPRPVRQIRPARAYAGTAEYGPWLGAGRLRFPGRESRGPGRMVMIVAWRCVRSFPVRPGDRAGIRGRRRSKRGHPPFDEPGARNLRPPGSDDITMATTTDLAVVTVTGEATGGCRWPW